MQTSFDRLQLNFHKLHKMMGFCLFYIHVCRGLKEKYLTGLLGIPSLDRDIPTPGRDGIRKKITLGVGIDKKYESGPGLKTHPVLEHW
jgi:hypothetical protein